ncbi:polyhomeotic-proximal chromatin protein-like [Battus philenor]|uniref:polyhomeotic-proximal chromatin protein-like n=1 Tax=Battus philenor TaxID=42288 RepID=UPI0035D13513
MRLLYQAIHRATLIPATQIFFITLHLTQSETYVSTEWCHSCVQVIQQPLQNSTYLQQLYNTQGQLIMPGNIALHPDINSQQIQVIAAGKPFQSNQLGPHKLTTQGKPVLQGQTGQAPQEGMRHVSSTWIRAERCQPD